jgi:hypothetical protein
MTILIDVKNPEWLKDEVLYRELTPLMSSVDVRIGANPGNPKDIEMLIASNYTRNRFGLLAHLCGHARPWSQFLGLGE